MSNQKLTAKRDAYEQPFAVPAPLLSSMPNVVVDDSPVQIPAPALVARAASASRGRGAITLLAAEHTATHLIDLPKASARQQAAMMRFAVEDLVAAPLDTVVVSKGPGPANGAGGQIAFVTSQDVLDAYVDVPGVLPEFLMVPAPGSHPAWNVWRIGDRAVVRASDGTGFAASMALLPVLWKGAGSPPVSSLGDALPAVFGAADLSANPPAVAAGDLTFQFAADTARDTQVLWRTAVFAGLALIAAAVLHLAILAGDTWALGQQAEQARLDAQVAIAPALPGVTLTEDTAPILGRLAPPAVSAKTGPFLPLFADVSAVLGATPGRTDTPVTFRRLAWGNAGNQLVLLVQAGGLDHLQRLQMALETNGFNVRTGAANAGEGGAQAEMRITRGDG